VILLLLTDISGRVQKLRIKSGCVLMLEWTLTTGVCVCVCVCVCERDCESTQYSDD